MHDFQNFFRKCEKKREEDIDKMDEILHKKRKMIVDVEELIGVILPAAAVLYQVKEKKERTKSKA